MCALIVMIKSRTHFKYVSTNGANGLDVFQTFKTTCMFYFKNKLITYIFIAYTNPPRTETEKL